MSKKRRKPKRRKKGESGPRTVQRGPRVAVMGPDGDVVELVEYEIVFDPLPEPYLEKLTPQEQEDLDRVRIRLTTEPGNSNELIEILEPLIRKYPDFPKLYNYLSVAYVSAGRQSEGLELAEETYRRFPNYLFARINQAIRCLHSERPEEVPEIFEHHFALHHLHPERRGRFHVSEFVQFHAVIGLHFAQIGQTEKAAKYLEMAKQVEPDHPLVRMLATKLRGNVLARLLGWRP